MVNIATRNLIVRAGFDASGMRQGVRQADGMLRQFGQNTNRQMSGISRSISSSMGKIGGILASAFAVTAIVNFGKECMDLGSDLSEVQNVVDVTFGSMAEDVNKFAKTAITQLGLSETSAKQYTSTMGAMLKSMGMTTNQALTMSKTITALSADMASFYNLDPEVAFEKIRSGISGETEPLKQLGINMSVANMQAYAMSEGISKAYSKMTQQEQALLRYNYLLSVTADAQGDFARTSNSWANQTRILAEQFNALKAEIGQGLIAALTPVIKVLNFLVAKITVAASYFRAFMELIFGKQSVGGGSGIDSSMSDMADSVGGVEDSADSASKAVDKIGDSAKKAAKKAKGSLASFDELNVISQSDKSGSDKDKDGSGNGMLSGASIPTVDFGSVETTDTVLDELAKTLDEIFGKFKTIDFGPLVDSFNRLKKAIEPFTQMFFAGLKWAIDNVIYPLTKWTIEDALPAFLDVLSGALTVLNPLLQSFQPLASFLWENFLVPIASWTGGVIVTVLQTLADVLTRIGTWMSEHIEIVSAITTTLTLFFGAWKVAQLLAFIEMSGGVAKAIGVMTTAIKAGIVAKLADKAQTVALTLMYAKDFIVSLARSTVEIIKQTGAFIANKAILIGTKVAQVALTAATVIWNGICATATAVTTAFGAAIAFLTSPIGLVIVAITALVAGIILLVKNWDVVKEAAGKCWDWIVDKWNKASEWFNTNVTEPIKKFFVGLWEDVKTKASNCWNGIKEIWNVVSNWFSTAIIQPVKTKFTTFWEDVKKLASSCWNGIKEIWNKVNSWFDTTIIKPVSKAFGTLWTGIKTACVNAFNGIKEAVKTPLNFVIDMINKVINGLNRLKIDIPDGVPGIGGQTWGINIPNIPRLAKGGVLKQSTIVEAGEYPGAKQNPEIVTPQNLMYDTVVEANSELATSFFQAAKMIVNAIESKDTNVVIGDDVIGKSSVNYINKQTKLKGMSPILV